MNKVIKIIKNNILGFIIGAILFGGIGIAVAVQSNIASSDISYTNSKNANVTSVKQAVDDLYGKVKDTEELSAKLAKYAEFVPEFVKSCETSNYLVCKVINQFISNTISIAVGYGIYYHNGTITGTTAGIDTTTTVLDAEDLSYRYAGTNANVNNYVCFGSDADECPENNLYRIIGAFTFDNGSTYNIKLIKNTQYSITPWDKTGGTSGSNTWMRPADIRTTLNGTYLTSLGDWSSKIITPTYKVGGDGIRKISDGVSVKTSYTNEMASLGGTNKPITGDTDANGAYVDKKSKIGLMYVSDYGYAASPSYWKTSLIRYDTAAKDYDWIFTGSYQFTITRNADYDNAVYYIGAYGSVYYVWTRNTDLWVRPVFYLNSNVEVSSGIGTSTDPWRIKLS